MSADVLSLIRFVAADVSLPPHYLRELRCFGMRGRRMTTHRC
jgi:hypothetical protein